MQYTDMEEVKVRIKKHLDAPYAFNAIHGSGECCFENIAFCVGMSENEIHDTDILDFFELYLKRFCSADELMSSDFTRSMMLNCLLYMGRALGRRDGAVADAFRERLDRVRRFAVSGERIFYTEVERERFKSVPAVWKDVGIVRREHTSPYLCLPYVYDLLGFSVMYGMNAETDKQIEDVVSYIFSERYQEEVEHGYGIGVNGEKGFVKSAYYAVGWDVGLRHLTPRQALLYMRLLSPVPAARSALWYQANLSTFRSAVQTGDETLLSGLCRQARKTYWSSGCYLCFGRSPKGKRSGVREAISAL